MRRLISVALRPILQRVRVHGCNTVNSHAVSPHKPWWLSIFERTEAWIARGSHGLNYNTPQSNTSWFGYLLQNVAPGVAKANLTGEVPKYKLRGKRIDCVPLPLYARSPHMVEKIAPSVVNVCVTEDVHGKSVTNNNGSGVIVNADGTILTAFDLVANPRWWFGKQWTAKGQITVGLYNGRRIVANLASADKDLRIAVLKISSEDKLKAAVAGRMDDQFIYYNVEWPATEENTIAGNLRLETGNKIHLCSKSFVNFCETNREIYGGPFINCYGNVVGISQKSPEGNSSKDSIFGTPIKNAMKMVDMKMADKEMENWGY